MSRKDYELIARALAPINRSGYSAAAATIAIAEMLEDQDARFKRDVFLTACGLTKAKPAGIPMRNMRDFDKL
jgi:hypothetical protein